ncbi:MAG: hypothetical protein ACOWWR_03345 [Eubacteriales bacterium]
MVKINLYENSVYRNRTKWITIILILQILLALTPVAFANSMEPPSIIIIVSTPPDDMKISIDSGDTHIEAKRKDNKFESYFTFYVDDVENFENASITVNTKEKTFQVFMEEPLNYYNNLFTLNLRTQTITPGKSLIRSILLVSLRIILTLIIEGLVLFLFRYRKKTSWIAFLIINLITQGVLNIMINGFSPFGSYPILGLIFLEFFVLITEIFAFIIFVKEKRKFTTLMYVFISNILSLILGGYLITVLPI